MLLRLRPSLSLSLSSFVASRNAVHLFRLLHNSSASDVPPQDAQLTTQWELATLPGTSLSISSHHSSLNIVGTMGTTTTQLKAASHWPTITTGDTRFPKTVTLTEPSDLETQHASPSQLHVSMPEKWVSLVAKTQGQPISVGKIVEATLDIDTQGGAARIGTIRALDAHITTVAKDGSRSGSLEGRELSGSQVTVRTGSSPTTLTRLVGQAVSVALQGEAALKVAAVYGERVFVSTEKGGIHFANMDCSLIASLTSQGGPILIESMDGTGDITSGGGSVEVHLHNQVTSVTIDSGGGSVRLAVSQDAHVRIEIQSGGSVESSYEEETDGVAGSTGRVYSLTPDQGPSGRRSGTGVVGSVKVRAGTGAITIVREGWVDAMKRKITSGKPEEARASKGG